MKYLLTSLLLLLPCFWNVRVQAGDLASHTYNIWLADLIRAGHLPGLFLADIRTNVLFDLLEENAIHALDYEYGEKFSIALAVLVFFWGAFTFIGAVSKSSAWPIVPLLAMFTYGWVFHMGFANFFLSMGLMLFALALFITNRKLAWLPLLPAVVAHMIPVGWACGLMAYALVYERVAQRRRLLIAGVALIAVASASIALAFPAHWHISQALGMLGVDQLWLFDSWYAVFAMVILFLFGLALVRGASLANLDGHFFLLSAAAVLCVPWVIQLPWYDGPLSFITQRMSLTAAIPMLAVVARAAAPKQTVIAGSLLAALYFAAIYNETSRIDRMETALRAAVQQVPRGARVVAKMPDTRARFINVYGHLVDRACIAHCFSYGNYEPATAQFRVRLKGPNPYVAHDTKMSLDLQTAIHTTTPRDAPLYMFEWTGAAYKLRILQPGDRMSD
mgnify:CR=1 FL=1